MQVKSMFSSRSIPVNSWRMPFLKAGSTAQVLHNTPGKKQNRAQSALSDSYSLTYAKREQGIIAGSKRPCRSQPAWIAGTERENALSRIAVATMHRRRRMAWSFVDPPHLPRPAPPQATPPRSPYTLDTASTPAPTPGRSRTPCRLLRSYRKPLTRRPVGSDRCGSPVSYNKFCGTCNAFFDPQIPLWIVR